MIKVFTKNENGKIELTEEELTKLLEEASNEGYQLGYQQGYNNKQSVIIQPTYPASTPRDDWNIQWTCTSNDYGQFILNSYQLNDDNIYQIK